MGAIDVASHGTPAEDWGGYLKGVVEPRSVLGGDQAISEDPALLVAPEPQELVLCVGVFRLDHQEALENLHVILAREKGIDY